MQATRPKKRVAFLVYDGITALDLFGPMEAFHSAQSQGGLHYETVLLGNEIRPYKAESGAQILPDLTIKEVVNNVFDIDTLVVPGGEGSRKPDVQRVLCPWLTAHSHLFNRILSVCTGAFLLAEAGLLNGKKATTHWQYCDAFAKRYPKVALDPDSLFLQSQHISTSAGISSGIDLALKIIEDDCGSEVAANIARVLVVHYRRSGDQAQFSQPLKFQKRANQAFASLTGWILEHLQDDLSTLVLAEQAGMSERNFYRRFKQQMKISPARYVETLRLDYARQLLTDKTWPNKRIAQACGYAQVDVFRRAFERRFGLSPKEYRHHFRTQVHTNLDTNLGD